VYILKDVPKAGFDVPKAATLTALRHSGLAKLAVPPEKYVADNRDVQPILDTLSKMGATILDTPQTIFPKRGRPLRRRPRRKALVQ
jgi:hypothetical protein